MWPASTGVSTAASDELVACDQLLTQCGSDTCLRYRLPPETITIDCPEIVIRSKLVQLEILFRNLIDNAVKYGGSPPSVEVAAKANRRRQGHRLDH